jgi:flagellum-specific peptidoglycan hydrolase FlgJ
MYGPATKEKTKWFIDTYGEGIAQAIKGTGLYFPAIIAQKALESAWGKSDLARLHNNWGGIKCNRKLDGVIGCTGLLPTNEWTPSGKKYRTMADFSKFKDTASGFKVYLRILMADRYKNARLNATSAKEQILMLAKAGYTTTPPKEYLSAMSGIIEAAQDYRGLGRVN